MITTKEFKIPLIDNITSQYIESNLTNIGLDFLRWAITKIDSDYITVNVSYIKKIS